MCMCACVLFACMSGCVICHYIDMCSLSPFDCHTCAEKEETTAHIYIHTKKTDILTCAHQFLWTVIHAQRTKKQEPIYTYTQTEQTHYTCQCACFVSYTHREERHKSGSHMHSHKENTYTLTKHTYTHTKKKQIHMSLPSPLGSHRCTGQTKATFPALLLI